MVCNDRTEQELLTAALIGTNKNWFNEHWRSNTNSSRANISRSHCHPRHEMYSFALVKCYVSTLPKAQSSKCRHIWPTTRMQIARSATAGVKGE